MGQNIFWSIEDSDYDHDNRNVKLIESVDSCAKIIRLRRYSDVLSQCKENEDKPTTAVILDYRLGDNEDYYADGIRALDVVLDTFPDIPVFMLTGESSAEHVLNPLNLLLKYRLLAGYYEKNIQDMERLKKHLQSLQEMQQHDSKALNWFRYIDYMKGNPYRLLGSTGWRYRDLSRMAMSNAPILIQGPTGSGKELTAHRIHEESHRSKADFVPVNCSAIPDTLFEPEFFGSVVGAFSDATERDGYLIKSDGGSLFLDEVADLSLLAQAKLLRALEEGFRKVGTTQVIKVNVRIISATNKDLQHMVRRGKFRHDLYSRLNGMSYKTYGLNELDKDEKEEELKLFLQRCLAEAYEERREILTANVVEKKKDKTQSTAIPNKDEYGIAEIAIDILCKRMKAIKSLFTEESEVKKHPHKRANWQKDAWILLGIPCMIPKRKWDEFTAYDWPHNYREIRSAVQTAVGKGGWEHVQLEDLELTNEESVENHLKKASELYLSHPVSDGQSDISPSDFKQQAENELFGHAIKICNGNLNNIANMLHVSTSTVSKNEIYKGRKD
jgi:DNA-binding NtrC family response regulator